MESSPSILNKPPPPFPAPPRSIDFSALEFILGLLAVITIPALIYAVFFAIKCPPNPFRHRRTSYSPTVDPTRSHPESSVDLKYQKDEHVKDIGTECPVCLSVFADGEEVRQLSVCRHSFHGSCINMWLKDHSNCPVCRANIAVDQSSSSNTRTTTSSGGGGGVRDDLQQGLPDASAMV